jgi:hypothetical protein
MYNFDMYNLSGKQTLALPLLKVKLVDPFLYRLDLLVNHILTTRIHIAILHNHILDVRCLGNYPYRDLIGAL